jgi:protein-disulfide isomerase
MKKTGVCMLLLVAACLALAALACGGGGEAEPTATAATTAAPSVGFVLGDSNAPVTIYEYADFQCPYCARAAAEIVPRLNTDYLATGKAKLIFKIMTFIGEESKWAAEAAACAADQGKFWEYHNKLFEEQNGKNKGTFKVENLKRFARDIGLNQGEFNTCFDSGKYTSEIADQMDEAGNRGVFSTPTFFVGQTAVDNNYDTISKAIDAALAGGGGAQQTPTPQAAGASGYTESDPEYQLASLDKGTVLDLNDPSINAYARALDAAEAKCTNGRRAISDYAVTGQRLLADEGIKVTLLQAVRAIDQSIPDGSPKLDCAEIAAVWVTLQMGQ